jgi:pyridoxine/pyridoxamine 5'-phosphate oxidase
MNTRDLLRGLPVLAHEMPPFEFWQADRDRRHVRLRYRRAGDGWARELLWP